jgi:hypothetical protein
LKRQLDGVVVNEDKCKAIITGKQRLALEHLVVGQGHLPPEIVASEGENQISRGIFITDRCVLGIILYNLECAIDNVIDVTHVQHFIGKSIISSV